MARTVEALDGPLFEPQIHLSDPQYGCAPSCAAKKFSYRSRRLFALIAPLKNAVRRRSAKVTSAPGPLVALNTPPSPEVTATIVIGSGFSGLAMATELHRQGIESIVLDNFCPTPVNSPTPSTGGINLEAMTERAEILRLLQHYASRHELDVRPHSAGTKLLPRSSSPGGRNQWSVQTSTGTVSAQTIVFTRVALNQLRRMLHSLGITTSQEVGAAMSNLGLYLVGVGDITRPSTQEILHQAKRASQAISARLELSRIAAVPA